MRRKDKEIIDREEIDAIINEAKVCRIALSLNNVPYVVPVNFGYKDNCIYFHSALEGKKIDWLKENNNVCFEMDIGRENIQGNIPCSWGTNYKSVIGMGKATFVNEFEEKKSAMNIIFRHYSDGSDYEFREKQLNRIALIKIEIEEITGKKSENKSD